MFYANLLESLCSPLSDITPEDQSGDGDFHVGQFLAMKVSPFKALEQPQQFSLLEEEACPKNVLNQ